MDIGHRMRQLRNLQTGDFLPNRRLVLLSTPQKVQSASRSLRLDASNVGVPWTRTSLVPVAFDRQTLRPIRPMPRSHMKSHSPQSSCCH